MDLKSIRIFSQVVLSVWFLLIVAIILESQALGMGTDFLITIFGGIPGFDMWVDFLVAYSGFELADIVNIYIRCFFGAIITGTCMTVCKKICDFLVIFKVLPFYRVVVTFVGLAIGFAFNKLLDVEEGLSLIAVGLISVYGVFLMARSILPVGKYLTNIISIKDILIIIINSIVAVIITGFIATIHVFKIGGVTLSTLLIMTLVTIVSLLILYAVDGEKSSYKM